MAPAAVSDKETQDGERITKADVEAELERINYTLKPLDIVLVRTGADAFWGRPEYLVTGALEWAETMETKGLPGLEVLEGYLNGLAERGAKLPRNWVE